MGVVLISADLSNGELSMRVMYHLLIMTLQSEQVLPVIFLYICKQLKSSIMSKLNLNFATRVVTRVAPKYDGAGAGNGERMKVYAETNDPDTKVNLDKSIYAKTAEDRLKVAQAKVEWIRSGNSAKWLAQWGKPSVKLKLKN